MGIAKQSPVEKNELEIIQIACNIDERYTKYCAVMLVSLFENNRQESFHIHIIADRLSASAQDVLTGLTEKYGNQISYYFNLKHLLKDCSIPESSHISLATYFRCFLDTILSDTVEKVLYLDSDMIVCDNIRELWQTDLSDCPVAAIEDMWSSLSSSFERLEYDQNYGYFNAGVLLINLRKWRQSNVSKQALDTIQKNRDRYIFFDQDVLNKLFHEKKLFLPFRWNMQDGFFRKKRKVRREAWNLIDQAMLKPAIIHFTGSKKPWDYFSFHPYKQIYFQYQDKTPWKGERPKGTATERWNSLFYRFNDFLGLKNGYRKIL